MCERICEDRAATETQGLKMELRDCLNFLVVHTNQQTPDIYSIIILKRRSNKGSENTTMNCNVTIKLHNWRYHIIATLTALLDAVNLRPKLTQALCLEVKFLQKRFN
uniref:Uncharacterized protein n=1 Tax=Rhizophagus irregularis (strain DAOM 181602 / DAOM 197198 / MUCL 43194) TaxID=747089 RepID=U9U0H1_RHIID